MNEIAPKIKKLINSYIDKRSGDLTFGPIFKNERTFFSLDKSNLFILSVPKEIIKILDEEGYYCPDYRQGYAYKKDDISKKKHPIKILKILSKNLIMKNDNQQKYNELKRKFETRLITNRKDAINCKICITYNPFDIGLMSTYRNWTSCVELNKGDYKLTPLKQIQYGGMCAYLIKDNDIEIKQPIARIAIKRLIGNIKFDFILISENKIYGDSLFAKELKFDKKVKEILNLSNNYTSGNSKFFKRNDRGCYSDSGLEKIYKLNFSSEDDMIKYINRYSRILKNEYFYQGAALFDIMNNFILSDKFIEKFNDKINWKFICQYLMLSEEFIKKHKKSIIWSYISEYQELSEEFIEKYKNKVDWYNISEYQKLSEEFIEKYKRKVNWIFISSEQKLSQSFIRKFKSKLNWSYISQYQKLSEPFIDEFKEMVSWYGISVYQKLSEEFIEKHNNDVYWDAISIYQKLSEEFIEKYKDKVDWDNISEHQNLSENFIELHKDHLNFEIIFKYQNVSKEFKKKMKKYLKDK